jgi:rhamnosyltransferase
VIVTYHPDAELVGRIERVAGQLDRVVVVDNGSTAEELAPLGETALSERVHLIRNDANLGVATALNQGMSWAKQAGCEWAFTLDQDSTVYEGTIEKLAEVYKLCCRERRIAVIGSNYFDSRRGEVFMAAEKFGETTWKEVVTVITSGSLVSLRAYEEIGPFRDEFFIDHVDDEYCLRARKMGYSVVITREPLIEHTISAPRRVKFLWKRLTTPDFPPLRRYYMARNHVVLVREYRRGEPDWVAWSVRVRLKELELMLVLEKDKVRKTLKFLKGLFDGLTGRMGPRVRD